MRVRPCRRRRTAWRPPRGPRPPTRRPQIEALDLGQVRPRPAPPVAALPEPHRLEMLRAGDMGDALAAKRRQMRHRQRRRRPRRPGAATAPAGRRPGRTHRRPAGRAPADRSAARLSARRAVTTRPSMRLPRSWSRCWRSRAGIVGRVAHEDGDALFRQPLLERLDDREGEASETVVGDDADGARLRPMQALRQVVRPVADLARDALHLFARSPGSAGRRR